MQYPTIRNAPIAFTGIRPFPRFPTRDATLLQAGKTCTYPLPTLPYIHSKTTIVPLRCFDYKIFHIGITIVCQPTSDVLRQVEFQPSVALTTTTGWIRCLNGAFELGLTFLMKIKTHIYGRLSSRRSVQDTSCLQMEPTSVFSLFTFKNNFFSINSEILSRTRSIARRLWTRIRQSSA